MKIGPRYKIARRLGVGVFEKTQTQKFTVRTEQKRANSKSSKPRAKSEYGLGMIERQKARFGYGITSKQFSNYIEKAIDKKGNTGEQLISLLEARLDNVALRAGYATTRQAARQVSSHGHLTVNGKIVTIPSYQVKVGDVIGIREGSKKKALFNTLDDRFKTIKIPSWLKLNFDKKEVEVVGIPHVAPTELLFNVGTVLEFYSR